MVNFVGLSVIHVSQGSVATYVRCGGMSIKHYIANFLMSLSVKKFQNRLRLEKVIAKNLVASFLGHGVHCCPLRKTRQI